MIIVGKLLLAAFSSVTAFVLWKSFQFVHRLLTSPVRHLRGPKGTSWLYGNLQDTGNLERTPLYEEWVKQYGSTLTYKGFFYSNRLLTMDTRAINHVLTHSTDYYKPLASRYIMSELIGEGLLVVEGAQHRQQRRIMNPAFGPAQIRELADIFYAKAVQLRDIWLSEIAKDPAGAITGVHLNVMPWMNRMSLDVISLAGFNSNLNALNANEKPNQLSEAFGTIIAAGQNLSVLPIFQAWFPPLRLFPSKRARRLQFAHRTMARIGKELISGAKAVARVNATEKGEIGKNSLHGRDLLSLLVKANMATDIPESQKLSDEDVIAQICTFLFAGHETTSAAMTWAFYAMTKEPRIQTKLREELLSVDTDTPSVDELMALPYLDAVVKETLRLYAPGPVTGRVAMKDDVLPVEKPITDKYGVAHGSISVKKGDLIVIPVLAVNRSQELWGPDAHEFKPERWENIPEAVSQIPGVWGNQLTFLGGPRACIAYRFTIIEMKALLFVLLRALEFELAVPAGEFIATGTDVQRPVPRSDPKGKPQLPLVLKPYQQT